MNAPELLLLTPSNGFGGGIERVACAIERVWPGPLRRIDLYRAGVHLTPGGRPGAKAAFAARALAAARSRPDVVLAIHVGLLPAALPAALLARAPLALMAMGHEVWARMPAREQALVQQCSRVLAISSFTGMWLARRAGLPSTRISVVPIPIEAAIARRALERPSPHRRAASFLTVSRLARAHRYKGHFEIAESLPAVLAREPRTRWLVVGEGDDLPALRARCERIGVAGAVDFLGAVEDDLLTELYADASALVLPSVTDVTATPPSGEGFGLVYAEAGAFAVPSVASRAAGGSSDLVVDRQTGLTVAPGDRRALADAMLSLVADPGLRDRLGCAARSRVLERHLIDRFGARLTAALTPGRA